MNYLPLFFNVSNQVCLVVGGSDVALRKCRMLKKCGANIKLVGLEIIPELKKLLDTDNCSYQERAYQCSDLDNCFLAVAATCVEEVNQQIHKNAVARNIPVNVVDQPDLCTFIFPSVIDRDPVTVAISSGGQSPILARLLRAKLETLIPANYGALAALAGKYRNKVKEAFSNDGVANSDARRKFWEKTLQGSVAERVFSHQPQEAENLLEEILKASLSSEKDGSHSLHQNGEVYLVGAGPGDPDLLTFRALRLMQQADVVLYDRLVSKPILDLVRKDAEQIYVGKKQTEHTVEQKNINQILIELAKEGKRVLRLKGGDPFIFGRGGEEIEGLAAEDIPFQVVPGITAASGCSTYAGIPLTHRDYAQSVRFLTGHLKEGAVDLHWPELLDKNQTLVFYMGLTGMQEISAKLIEHGRDKTTPIALIEKGTTPEQRVFIGTLENISDLIEMNNVKAPTLSIVGDVVHLHEKLHRG